MTSAGMPAGHPVGLHYEALDAFESELDGEVGMGSGMHDKVIGWDNEVPVERDNMIPGVT